MNEKYYVFLSSYLEEDTCLSEGFNTPKEALNYLNEKLDSDKGNHMFNAPILLEAIELPLSIKNDIASLT